MTKVLKAAKDLADGTGTFKFGFREFNTIVILSSLVLMLATIPGIFSPVLVVSNSKSKMNCFVLAIIFV
jgi:hypothetical protein